MAAVLGGLWDDYRQISDLMTEWIRRRNLELLGKRAITACAGLGKEVMGFGYHFRREELPFLAFVAWLTALFAFARGFPTGLFFTPGWIGRRRTGGV